MCSPGCSCWLWRCWSWSLERLSPRERLWLVVLAAFMIAAHQSHIPLALVLSLGLLTARRFLGAPTALGNGGLIRIAAPLAMAVIALIGVQHRSLRARLAITVRQRIHTGADHL